jgi:acylphosphatase
MPIHKNITITGDVQGVGFRFSAREMAKKLDLKGFVRNEPDGSLYIEVEGVDNSIRVFVEWCHTGPGMSSVERVLVNEGSVKGFALFQIVL